MRGEREKKNWVRKEKKKNVGLCKNVKGLKRKGKKIT